MQNFLTKLSSISGEDKPSDHLRLLGRRAAGLFTTKEAANLNAAVASIVGDEGLNKEQAERVAEIANQETWKAMFVEGGDRNTSFDPANPSAILERVSSQPTVVRQHVPSELDFINDVPNQTPDFTDLAAAFNFKSDTPEYEALSAGVAEGQEVAKVASARDGSRRSLEGSQRLLTETFEEFYHQVKQAHLRDGVGFLQLTKVAGVVMEDSELAKTFMQEVGTRLKSEGVRFNEAAELEKVAHPLVINHEHPLAQLAKNLEQAAVFFADAHSEFQNNKSALKVAHKNLRQAIR
jgi:hypothetical protein